MLNKIMILNEENDEGDLVIQYNKGLLSIFWVWDSVESTKINKKLSPQALHLNE